MVDIVSHSTHDDAMQTSKPGRTRTVAYLRVSTDKQADHGVSLEA